MPKTLLDIDGDLLAEAALALGTPTKKDTVTEALRLAVRQSHEHRARALAKLQDIAQDGGFDFDRLDELDE
ncbi:type II toxin-antitoxin system VapB family antitoxin [Jiangella gansuensis]|uniref:type II toxin-antitoxin system VapB family antitoxin n=1 Tax=Jiangella gansuensis TaxID=281473 RepID=UPI00047A019F|nr:type II toxin-antitoxin system VapB family antitoxin [Jiangella gansuensis]